MDDKPEASRNRNKTYKVSLSGVPADAPVFEGTDVPVEYMFRYWLEFWPLISFLEDFSEVSGNAALKAIWERAKADLPVGSDRRRHGGMPVFKGTRVPVKFLFDLLKQSETLEEFLGQYTTVDREDAVRALEIANDLIEAVAYRNSDWISSEGEMEQP